MKKLFNDRLEAINWIANHVEDEGQFEVLREQLNFNFIYTKEFFITIDEEIKEVVTLDDRNQK